MYRKWAIFSIFFMVLFTINPEVQAKSLTQAVSGQPGLSYRYVKTFGVTEVPYLADTTHLNRPEGLFIDGSNNLFVGEALGVRVLKYSPTGTNLLAIGHAGQDYRGDYNFNNPEDMVLDSGGNIWVADGNRVVQYSASGTFLQQFPVNDPWQQGNDNGHFNWALGIALDHANRMFVSDSNNQRIQVFDMTSGSPVYSTTIGVTGVSDSDNNHFNQPHRIAVDSANALYVADSGNNRVQKCAFGGGTWACSTAAGLLNYPQGLTLDNSDNLYIADTSNGRIIKCLAGGTCNVLTSNTYWLYDLAVDSDGYLYGSTSYNATVVKYDSNGTFVSTFLGVENIPYLTDTSHFYHPRVSIDKDNNILVVENNGQRLIKLNPEGVAQWSIGAPGFDVQDNEHFNWPTGVASDKNGSIYVADNMRVQIFNGSGVYQATIGGTWGSGDYQFKNTSGIAIDQNDGNIYVADCPNQRVQVYNSSRVFQATIGETGVAGSDNGHFDCPAGVAVDTGGNIYVADSNNFRVQKFNSNRLYQMTFGTTGSGTNSLADVNAQAVAVDAQGRVYIGGWDNRVEVFNASGAYLTTIGGGYGNNFSDFRGVSSIAIDSQGNVYVGDNTNARIQKFAPGVPGWKQINVNGFGNVNNQGGNALKEFNGQLYVGVCNWNDGLRVWRTPDGINWSPASDVGFGEGVNNAAIIDMAVFGGKLYASVGWSNNAGQIWRTADGTTWEKVVDNGFNDSHNTSVYKLFQYNQMLYASTFTANPNTHGAQIWRTSTGNAGDWSPAWSSTDLNDLGVDSFIAYQGYIYGGVENKTEGLNIIRSTNGSDWTVVVSGGLGRIENKFVQAFTVFNNQLYLSTQAKDSALNDMTGQVWHSSNGVDWTQAPTAEFSASNFTGVEGLTTFNQLLYAFVNSNDSGMHVFRSSDGSHWQQINPDGFGHATSQWSFGNDGTVIFQGKLTRAIGNWQTGVEIWQELPPSVYLPFVKR